MIGHQKCLFVCYMLQMFIYVIDIFMFIFVSSSIYFNSLSLLFGNIWHPWSIPDSGVWTSFFGLETGVHCQCCEGCDFAWGIPSYILVLSMHLTESPMTAEIAQKWSCPFDKVPPCNQPCLLLALHSGNSLEICRLSLGRGEREPQLTLVHMYKSLQLIVCVWIWLVVYGFLSWFIEWQRDRPWTSGQIFINTMGTIY